MEFANPADGDHQGMMPVETRNQLPRSTRRGRACRRVRAPYRRSAGLILCAMACVAMSGCRRHGDLDLLLRDLRWTEDRVYQLEGELAFAHSKLDAAQQANTALRERLVRNQGGTGSATSGGEPDLLPEIVVDPTEPREEGGLPPGEGEERPARRRPQDRPRGRLEPPVAPQNDAHNGLAPLEELGEPVDVLEIPRPGAPLPGGTSSPPAARPSEGSNTSRIEFNRLLTGIDGSHGAADEKVLRVVLEQHDARGRPAIGDGELSLVLVDDENPDAPRRLARWNFSKNDLDAFRRETPLGQGLHIDLPWPVEVGVDTKPKLVARFITPQGDKLFAQCELSGVEAVAATWSKEQHGLQVSPQDWRRSAGGANAVRTAEWTPRPGTGEGAPRGVESPTNHPVPGGTASGRRAFPDAGRETAPPARKLRRPTWSPQR